MKLKQKLVGLAVGAVLSIAVFGMHTAAEASAPVTIDEEHFPDAVFREYVANFDTDGDGVLSVPEMDAVWKIEIRNTELADMTGVAYFSKLTNLYISGNHNLTELDVSKNTKLCSLDCTLCDLSRLDVRANTELELLSCSGNRLSELDLSQNSELEFLYCGNNELTSLDVSANTKLEIIHCAENQLTSLDVSANTELEQLYCTENELTGLDVSANAKLGILQCTHNHITSLDLSQNTKLGTKIPDCDGGGLQSITLPLCRDDEKEIYYIDLSAYDLDAEKISAVKRGTYNAANGRIELSKEDADYLSEHTGFIGYGEYEQHYTYLTGWRHGYEGYLADYYDNMWVGIIISKVIDVNAEPNRRERRSRPRQPMLRPSARPEAQRRKTCRRPEIPGCRFCLPWSGWPARSAYLRQNEDPMQRKNK